MSVPRMGRGVRSMRPRASMRPAVLFIVCGVTWQRRASSAAVGPPWSLRMVSAACCATVMPASRSYAAWLK